MHLIGILASGIVSKPETTAVSGGNLEVKDVNMLRASRPWNPFLDAATAVVSHQYRCESLAVYIA
jgi:hypothetical protein